jgi:hypothetical protein
MPNGVTIRRMIPSAALHFADLARFAAPPSVFSVLASGEFIKTPDREIKTWRGDNQNKAKMRTQEIICRVAARRATPEAWT